MTHKNFLDNWLGKQYSESPDFGPQCVALVKLYEKAVNGVTLGRFGGSALTGWKNDLGTFDKYTRVINDYGDPDNYPKQGDIIFFNNMFGPYGHVAIVDNTDGYTVTVLEQNGGGGSTGRGDDAIRLQKYSFEKILGWFTKSKEEEVEEKIDGKVCSNSNQSLEQKIDECLAILKGLKSEDEINYQCILMKSGWFPPTNGVITYKFENRNDTISDIKENIIENNCFKRIEEWLAPIKFIKLKKGEADITIRRTRNGNDDMPVESGKTIQFGPGVLAFAFLPNSKLRGQMFLNLDANISVNGEYKLLKVFVHEALHLLGMSHSDNPDSIMYYRYRSDTWIDLPDDELRELRNKYNLNIIK